MYDLQEYLEPLNIAELNDDAPYADSQYGSIIEVYEEFIPDLAHTDIVIIGINECRGGGYRNIVSAADAVRKQFYRLFYWHKDIRIADLGNIKTGATIADSYSAAAIVVEELVKMNKKVLVLGGSHDNTMAQYNAFKALDQYIEATVIDAKIDLQSQSMLPAENFLLDMLTGEPNMVQHYNHIGFQSYFVHPHMLETIDKLRFDCFRVGIVKEQLEEMEPVLRNSHLVSFDISAIKNSDAPATDCSPNGLSGEESCSIARYAGMSPSLATFGIYGFDASKDKNDLTALQISQMLWYFVDGLSRSKQEANMEDTHHFNEFHTAFAEVETLFLQSKRTGRWWMQLPDKKLIACSYNDYLFACNNEIPERWIRAQERD